MRSTTTIAAFWLLLALSMVASSLALPQRAAAQEDLLGVVPFIMLVVDTSGSMERLPTCTCTTPSCEECLPNCAAANDANGQPPANKKNRWALTLEALTGTFNDFECESIARTAANGMSYDMGFSTPYFQPWDCTSALPGQPCAYNASNSTRSQNQNGILDLNVSGIRFGLMTFDGMETYAGFPPLLSFDDFDDARSEGQLGMWSYGGKQRFHYPFCPTSYYMDTGVRSPSANEGALISLDSCSGPGPVGTPGCPAWCTACPGTQQTINHDIQNALLATRPYGGTPIAGALTDLQFHLGGDLSDQYRACRDRYAILITDGYPDDDYRFVGCGCYEDGDGSDCGGPPNNPIDMRCPYQLPETVAAWLVEGGGGFDAVIERLFVVGLAVDDPSVVTRLDAIADSGCTGTAEQCEIGDTGYQALFASDLDTLRSAVQIIVDEGNKPISRTIPVFVNTNIPAMPQLMFTSALKLPTQAGEPWSGLLERSRYLCSASETTQDGFVALNQSEGDLFHQELNQQTASRRLLTAYPEPVGSLTIREGTLSRTLTGACLNGCAMRELRTITEADKQVLLNTASTAQTLELVDWMYGANDSARDDAALGAIYHSTPAVSGAPIFDTADPEYNAWRRRPDITGRPQVLFVGTNDGILHAFSTTEFTNTQTRPNWRDLRSGEELWGFVPAMYLNDLRTNLSSHQLLMDGAPVVKTVMVNRDTDGADFRTILVMGLRDGGSAYFALDVTDPFNPIFLWQYTSPTMGRTYAQAAIAQSRFDRDPGVGGIVKDGAIVILPGGVGQPAAGGIACDGGTTQSMRNGGAPFDSEVVQDEGVFTTANHRSDVRCWSPVGRSLHFLDIEDGLVLKQLYLTNPEQPLTTANRPIFPSPLVSAPAVFPDELSSPATRAFIADADGVVWRIDLSTVNPEPQRPFDGWTARPFHDIFFDGLATGGEVSYEAPILSVDLKGRPVVIVGTGDTANFAKPTASNRIVSLTEIETEQPLGTPLHYQALLNWELKVKPANEVISTTFSDGTTAIVDGLAPSELVSGPMALFEGQLFAGTFISVANSTDVCDLGRGRLFAVDYLQPDFADANPVGATGVRTFGPRRINAADPTDVNNIVNILRTNPAGDNVKIAGLTLVQVPSCSEVSTMDDFWGGTWAGLNDASPSGMMLAAHADDDRGRSDVVDQRGGSQISSIQVNLRPIVRTTKVVSWAGPVD